MSIRRSIDTTVAEVPKILMRSILLISSDLTLKPRFKLTKNSIWEPLASESLAEVKSLIKPFC